MPGIPQTAIVRGMQLHRPKGIPRLSGIPRAAWRVAAAVAALAGIALALPGLLRARGGAAEIWTDSPGVLIAAETFNASQAGNIVTVRWKDNLAEALLDAETPPSIVIGSGLRSKALAGRFRDLSSFRPTRGTTPVAKGGTPSSGSAVAGGTSPAAKVAFYPALLEAGRETGRQVLLPVSFDLELLAFSRSAAEPQEALTIDLATMISESGSWDSRLPASLSFSFRWDPDFLVAWLDAAGADFGEGGKDSLLSWNGADLDAALGELRFAGEAMRGTLADEDDFAFKYLVAPLYRHAAEERILFAPMRASEYFLLDANVRRTLDFRWISHEGNLRAAGDAVYLGLPAKSTGGAAADAFVRWLFTVSNQEKILEASDRNRASEGIFGIAGGFSSLVQVTEKTLARRMPELLFKAPSPDSLRIGNPLPPAWPALLSEVVGPWALRALRAPATGSTDTLDKALADYASRKPELLR